MAVIRFWIVAPGGAWLFSASSFIQVEHTLAAHSEAQEFNWKQQSLPRLYFVLFYVAANSNNKLSPILPLHSPGHPPFPLFHRRNPPTPWSHGVAIAMLRRYFPYKLRSCGSKVRGARPPDAVSILFSSQCFLSQCFSSLHRLFFTSQTIWVLGSSEIFWESIILTIALNSRWSFIEILLFRDEVFESRYFCNLFVWDCIR